MTAYEANAPEEYFKNTHENEGKKSQPDNDPDWMIPPAEPLPEPTYWPVALALGTMFILWGFISTMIITGVGMFVVCVALTGWIQDIRHEHQNGGESK